MRDVRSDPSRRQKRSLLMRISPSLHAHGLRKSFLRTTALALCLATQMQGYLARGGGGPEDLLLVVNEKSHASKTIANHYIQLRDIPPQNVVYLPNVPAGETARIEQFRRTVLTPVLRTIRRRKLTQQIDYIVYSADFPTRVNIASDTANDKTKTYPRHFKPFASVTAVTYFAHQVEKRGDEYVGLDANRYMRIPRQLSRANPFTGPLAAKFQEAVQQYGERKYQAAYDLLQPLIKEQGEQAWLHMVEAAALAQLNRTEEAVDGLVRAVELGWSDRKFVEQEAGFAQLRNDPRYKQALASISVGADPYLPTTSFDHEIAWAPNGLRNTTSDQGNHYYLSTVLSAGPEEALSVAETLAYLERSAAADGTRPQGKFYFALTDDVRTKTRASQFAAAIQALREAGYESEIVKTWAPLHRPDIAGLSFGVAKYEWKETGSTLLAGAISECLTSVGGRFSQSHQTLLTEMLKAGAAGSSGAVVEPYAIANKFPHAMIHVHYVRGASLAEAYYQSVYGPYQLLIVGDALCQPWHKPVEFDVQGIDDRDLLTDPRELQLVARGDNAKEDNAKEIEEYRIYIDGRLDGVAARGQSYQLTRAHLTRGWHDLTVVAVRSDNVASQSRKTLSFRIGTDVVGLSLASPTRRPSSTVELKGYMSFGLGPDEEKPPIAVYHNSRKVGSITSDSGGIVLTSDELGSGPVRLRGLLESEKKPIWSAPLVVELTDDPRR